MKAARTPTVSWWLCLQHPPANHVWPAQHKRYDTARISGRRIDPRREILSVANALFVKRTDGRGVAVLAGPGASTIAQPS
ncbi:unnamed protein product [Nippostrongylus brasiliensis]|uniref:Transposase n=1 Tax=Nippostrongylus brasiliensis TaxID=27835 RepID=A0A0N4Y0M1_NIPBR|nr:hypothetical protein Q1695_005091 [Nippostrongylus brasiliensis]VDL72681.1 unnamed protein product [Nippostrongylus brasiliensis]